MIYQDRHVGRLGMLGLSSLDVLTVRLPKRSLLTVKRANPLISLMLATGGLRLDRPQVGSISMLFMVTERRAYPPIEGGQSLAEAEPFPKRGLFFSADSAGFWYNKGLLSCTN
jgi:hypothetical protein